MPIYCVTGCDTVSSLHGHGKRSAFRVALQKSDKYKVLSSLGDNAVPTQHKKLVATQFVGHLYGDPSCTSFFEKAVVPKGYEK